MKKKLISGTYKRRKTTKKPAITPEGYIGTAHWAIAIKFTDLREDNFQNLIPIGISVSSLITKVLAHTDCERVTSSVTDADGNLVLSGAKYSRKINPDYVAEFSQVEDANLYVSEEPTAPVIILKQAEPVGVIMPISQ